MSNKKMKIAFLAKEYRHLEAFHIPFMKLLSDKGYIVHVYAAPDLSKERVKAEGFVCHDVAFERSPFKLSYIGVLKYLVESFNQEDFCLVHVNTPVAGVLGRIAAKITGIPRVVYMAHGFHFYAGAKLINWWLYYPIERLMAHFTDYILTINNEDYILAKKFHARKDIINIPGVGVNTEQFSFIDSTNNRHLLRTKLGIDNEDFVIVCVAELTRNKNQEQLIEAVEKLVIKTKRVRCLLVGTGDNEAFLKKLVNQKRMNKFIEFLGFRHDVPEIIVASDVVVLLSKREGLPKALMEGMACGKPIVASDIRGCHDLITHDENGILVPVGDVDATCNALCSLALNPSKQKMMGSNNIERVKAYSLDEILEIKEKLYEQILSRE